MIVTSTAAQAIRPDPVLTVSQWADEHRVLSSVSSAEPGQWRTERTPYLREIMDGLSVRSRVTETVFVAGAQVGKTEAGNNWIGYVIAHAPAPMLVLMPTDKTANDNVRTRIDPLIDGSPALRERVAVRGSKEGGNTLERKDFPGGTLLIRGANSAANLRSLPIRDLFEDEIDAYEVDLDEEGDPIALAEARTRTFGAKRKVYKVSTPTVEGRSRIWASFEATDKRRYYVPCPHCGEMQTIDWDRIKWESDTSEPYLVCAENGCVIEERMKSKMLAAGEWRATQKCADRNVRGYHLSALYSPYGWFSWREARDQFLRAHREKDRVKKAAMLKTWVNTVAGECWAERGEAPDWEKLYARREPYARNTVPAGGLVLTAAVDVQKNRIEVEVRAWGPRLESWSIDARTFAGDPSRLDGELSPWPYVTAMLSESWPHELGGRLAITTMAVDSGDETQSVYNWARKFPPQRVMCVKGSGTMGTLLATPKNVDVRADGVKLPHGVTLWMVGSSVAKSEFYGWMRQDRPAEGDEPPTGWVHWPDAYGQEWFEQITAEQLVPRVVRGFRTYLWEKTRERNEALDLHVYNRAAAAMIGVDRWEPKRWSALRAAVTVATPDPSSDGSNAHPKIKVKRGSYW